MTTLPSALTRWRAQLHLFAEDLAAELGRLVLRLAPTFDSIASSHADPSGNVDGFDGIANRGSYERLLASDWALQKAAPLEFLRRAAGGEHSFLRLARREPALPESTLALLDAGPDQLGGCRIVQLALLVLLAQRAESRNQQLHWQLLHHFGDAPFSGLDEAALRAFLDGRTGARSSEHAVRAQTEQLAKYHLWLIGPRAVTLAAPPGATRATLSELVVTQAQPVRVLLESGSRARQIQLELPESTRAARLLRDPFARPSARPSARVVPSSLPTSNLLLNAQGNRLYYRDSRGDLLSVPIANSPRAPAGKPRRHARADQHTIASVAGRGRKTVWLSHARGSIELGFADHTQRDPLALSCQGPLLDPPQALAPFAWFPGERTAMFEAADRSLWRADFRTQTARPIAEGVRGWLLQRDHYLVAVDRWLERKDTAAGRVLELKPFWASSFVERATPWQDASLAAPFGAATSCTLGLLEAGIWQLQEWDFSAGSPSIKRLSTIQPAAGDVALGIEAFGEHRSPPGLWLLDSQRREVRIASAQGERVVIRTGANIERFALANMAAVLALSTAEHELLVVDVRGNLLYRGSTAA